MSDGTLPRAFPILETQRLLLRELQPADAKDAFIFYSNNEVVRFYDKPRTTTEQVQQTFREHRARFENNLAMRWGITIKGDGRVVGTCGFFRDEPIDSSCWYATLSYVIDKPYWSNGYMTEALQAILRYGFEHYQLHRIEAYTALPNVASQRVLQKVGFHEEGYMRERFFVDNQFYDEKMFALLKSDFERIEENNR